MKSVKVPEETAGPVLTSFSGESTAVPDSGRWRLPSGTGLGEFAMQSGFLAFRLWESSRPCGDIPSLAARSHARPASVRLPEGEARWK